MSLWKKTMDYLGLGPDDAYEGHDANAPADDRAPRARRGPDPRRQSSPDGPSGDVRTVQSRASYSSRDAEGGRGGRAAIVGDPTVNLRSDPRGAPPPPPKGGRAFPTVAPSNTEPHTVRPQRFDEAQEVADKFKDGLPVIMNLEATERDVARRLIDFASGICYALDGSMEKVATGVYLLKPPAIRPRNDG
ncbi:hypothetical protein BH20ACT4_BH20ACT4_08360 [soil metagenome]